MRNRMRRKVCDMFWFSGHGMHIVYGIKLLAPVIDEVCGDMSSRVQSECNREHL